MNRTLKRRVIAGGLIASGIMAGLGVLRSARGRGAIFTLHHVRPKIAAAFDPNAHLEITPDFLDVAIRRLKRDGYRFVALEDLPAQLDATPGTPLAAFTLDDGYRDNLDHAAPVFQKHGVPYTVFVTKGFVERTHTLWWQTLARLLGSQTSLRFDFGQGTETLPLSTTDEKFAAFDRFADFIHTSDEADAVARLDEMARSCGIDPLAITTELTLDAAGLSQLAADPLASLGAHTVSHRALARLPLAEALSEIVASADAIEAITGRRPVSLAYPYGDARAVSARDETLASEAGLSVAVTTRPGTLGWGSTLTALPRISLNGFYQSAGAVSALASGIPFKLMGSKAG